MSRSSKEFEYDWCELVITYFQDFKEFENMPSVQYYFFPPVYSKIWVRVFFEIKIQLFKVIINRPNGRPPYGLHTCVQHDTWQNWVSEIYLPTDHYTIYFSSLYTLKSNYSDVQLQ